MENQSSKEQSNSSTLKLGKGLNVLSIDCEDWFCGLEIGIEDWNKYESRIEKSLLRLLGLLDETGTRATFFILGYLAEKFPQLVEEIAQRDHEVGSHGYSHQFVYKQTPDEFRGDLNKSIGILEKLSGQKVVSYRAPFFS